MAQEDYVYVYIYTYILDKIYILNISIGCNCLLDHVYRIILVHILLEGRQSNYMYFQLRNSVLKLV